MMDRAYTEEIEEAVLAAEHYLADPETARRKGYRPHESIYAAADRIRRARRADHDVKGAS